MKTTIFYSTLALISAIFLNSCTKKEGCTEPNATNYCEDCKKNDGSCIYQGSVIFWWKQDFATYVTSTGSIKMEVYLNEKYAGNTYLYKNGGELKYWAAAPACSNSDALTISKLYNNSKTQTMQVKFKFLCPAGSCLAAKTGEVTFSANTCTPYEIKN